MPLQDLRPLLFHALWYQKQKLLERSLLDRRKIQGLRQVAKKTTILEQDPPNLKTDGGLHLHPRSSTLKDGVFIA